MPHHLCAACPPLSLLSCLPFCGHREREPGNHPTFTPSRPSGPPPAAQPAIEQPTTAEAPPQRRVPPFPLNSSGTSCGRTHVLRLANVPQCGEYWWQRARGRPTGLTALHNLKSAPTVCHPKQTQTGRQRSEVPPHIHPATIAHHATSQHTDCEQGQRRRQQRKQGGSATEEGRRDSGNHHDRRQPPRQPSEGISRLSSQAALQRRSPQQQHDAAAHQGRWRGACCRCGRGGSPASAGGRCRQAAARRAGSEHCHRQCLPQPAREPAGHHQQLRLRVASEHRARRSGGCLAAGRGAAASSCSQARPGPHGCGPGAHDSSAAAGSQHQGSTDPRAHCKGRFGCPACRGRHGPRLVGARGCCLGGALRRSPAPCLHPAGVLGCWCCSGPGSRRHEAAASRAQQVGRAHAREREGGCQPLPERQRCLG